MSAREEGDPDSPICLVGEAPGVQELKQDSPFVGPAGAVLNRCLLAAGIDRSRVYILNTFPGLVRKDKKTGAAHGAGGVLWRPSSGLTEAGWAEAGWMLDRLAECGAKVIVPLGGIALSAVIPKTKGQIGKWRGSIIQTTNDTEKDTIHRHTKDTEKDTVHLHQAPQEAMCLDDTEYTAKDTGNRSKLIVPTYHPATVCWGSTHLQHVIATDLARVRGLSVTSNWSPRARTLVTNPSFDTSVQFLEKLISERRRADFDLELFGGQISAISLSNDPELAISIPFIGRARDQRWRAREETALWELIFRLLGDPGIPKVNQNITFDCHILMKLYGFEVQGELDDPMVLHSLIFPDLEKGLAFQASWLTDVPYYKDDGGKRAWEDPWRNIEAFWRYSALDAAVSLECFETLSRDYLPQSPWSRTYRETLQLIKPLIAMMLRGFRVDQEGLRAAKVRVKAETQKVLQELAVLAGGKFNPASPQQCCDLFYTGPGREPYLGKSGKPTTDNLALRRLVRRDVAGAREVQTFRKLKKRQEFLDSVKGERLTTSYNIRGAKTGRLSSEEDEVAESSRNLQNLNTEIRGLLIADDDDHVLIEFDLAGAEWFITGYLAGEPTMIRAHQERLDPHALTASEMFGCTYEEAKADSEDPDGLRQRGKRCNHSLNYGLGAVQFGLRYEMPEAEAKRLRGLYHKAYPLIQKVFWAGVQREILGTGQLRNCFGRVREFLGEPGPELWQDAYAHLPQSTVADIMRLAMIHVYENEPLCELRSQDHDAITIQCPADPAIYLPAAARIKEVMQVPLSYGGQEFRLGVDVKMGKTRNKKTMEKIAV